MILSKSRKHISVRNPNALALNWLLHDLHIGTMHWYIKHYIMDILDQVYERFIMIM